MAKVGISQGNPLAALGNILRKGPGRGSGRESKSPRREVPITKKPSFKGSKESLRESKDSAESPGRPSEPKSPKMFRFGIKRSSSRSKKGERDDSASDTSSVNSLNVLPVKEETMEAESSGLTVSRSAGVNDGKEKKEKVNDKTVSVSTTEASSKSSNRNSTYFKPPEVEPLTDLFASGELDALLNTNDGVEKDVPADSEKESIENEGEEEQTNGGLKNEGGEEQASSGSGLKRNSLRSSFRMYENRYKAETLEKKKERSPLSTTSIAVQSKESTKNHSTNVEHVAESTPTATGSQYTKSDEDSIVPSEPEVENSCKSEDKMKQEKENERRGRKLFDDELFPSDIPIRRVKASSAASPSIDAYAKAHRSPSPVAVVSEGKDEGRIVGDDIGENSASISASPSLKPTLQADSEEEEPKNTSTEKAPEEDKQPEVTSQDQKSTENAPPSPTNSETHFKHEADKDESMAKHTSETQKGHVCISPTSTHSVVMDQTVLGRTELEKESEERKSKTHPSTSVGHKRKEEKQRSPRSTRSNDARSRIQSGKVSSARSKFDSSSPSASPRLQRARASTESSQLASERKKKSLEDHDSKSPLWMSDMQKKKEQREKDKAKEQATTVKPSAVADNEDMSDWRKRVLERRRKAAEANAKSTNTDGKADRLSRSGRYRETGGVSTRTEKSPRKYLNSEKKKSPSPSSSKKSPGAINSTAKEASDNTVVKTEVNTEAKDEIQDKPENTYKTEEIVNDPDGGHETPTDTHDNPETTSKPSESVTSPKPEITSPKPKIVIYTKKFTKRSSSSEQVHKSVVSIDVKPSQTPAAENDVPERDMADDEVFEDTKQELPASTSLSNLPEKSIAETAGSRRSSNSSEKEVGVPFRSRDISHSRSPTPTSLTTGPLKLPADPGVPEWKKKMLERKKKPSNSKKTLVSKSEPEVPTWKKELLAKRAKIEEEVNNIVNRFQYI